MDLGEIHRLGRTEVEPTPSRIRLTLREGPIRPVELAQNLGLMFSTGSNHVACLRDCGTAIAVPEIRQVRSTAADLHLARALTMLVATSPMGNENAPGLDPTCAVPGRGGVGVGA